MGLALELHGDELRGYLRVLLRDEDAAREVFQTVAADAWAAFPSFEWRSSLRTWLYRCARHAALKELGRRRRVRRLPTGEADGLAQAVRSTTAPHLRAASEEWLERARATLTPDEQTLLTLRIDRRMSFEEIGAVLGMPDRRGLATLRKRFERLKSRLRAMAERDGLLGEAPARRD
jgi:RNA polymerase sigma-70 factor (ECF subfamily)